MNTPTATPPEYLAGLKSGMASFDGERSLLNAAIRELSALVSEALDLCVRARKLDNAIPRPGDDLAAWEAKARKALGKRA
jgi:hypothetical protein